MTKLDQLLQQFRAELGPEFVSTFVIGEDGLAISTLSVVEADMDGSSAARVAMIMKLGQKMGDKLNLGDLQDNLITTDKIYLLMRHLGDGSFNWSVGVLRTATLGNVRLMMSEYAKQLWDAIPH